MTSVQAPLIRDRLADLVRQAVARAQANGTLPSVAMPEVSIERPAKVEQGDFATSFALRAKRAVGPRGPNPMEIAGAISAQIAHDPPSYLAGVEAAPPGFLNFTLADDWLRQQVNAIVADGPEFGSVPLGNRARVQVEFVSANPTGPVHIGTARNAALGDSIARVLARADWDVQREYYYNDAGTQMERLAHSVWVRYQQALGRPAELANEDYGGEYVVEIAQDILREHGDRFANVPEDAAGELGALAAKQIMHWIETDLDRARVRFDNWFSEARVIREGEFQRVLDMLRDRGLV
jgi:arginyl-tRNA synthetase